MLPEHVHTFNENYYNYMNEQVDEIPENMQENIIECLNNVADDVKVLTKKNSNSTSDSESHVLDLGFDEKVKGSLTGSKKEEFIKLVCKHVSELLTTEGFDSSWRCYKASFLCLMSKIPSNICMKWIPLPKPIKSNRN